MCVGGELEGEGRGSSANAWGWRGFPCPFFSLRRFSWLDLVPPSPSPPLDREKKKKKIRSMRAGGCGTSILNYLLYCAVLPLHMYVCTCTISRLKRPLVTHSFICVPCHILHITLGEMCMSCTYVMYVHTDTYVFMYMPLCIMYVCM